MPLKKGEFNSGIKNLVYFEKGKSGYPFIDRSVICVICGERFVTKAANSRYCSKKCNNEGRKSIQGIYFTCQTCGVKFKRKSKVKKKNADANGYRFCSKDCGDISRTINGTKNYMYKAFLLKEIKCERCGISDIYVLEVHHKDKNRSNSNIENLEILCANCHTKEHYKQMETRTQRVNKIIILKEKEFLYAIAEREKEFYYL